MVLTNAAYLVEYEEWDREEAARGRLRAAAIAMGFLHFEKLWTFVLDQGQEPDYRVWVEAAAWHIPADPPYRT